MRENDVAKEAELNKLRSRSRDSEPDSRSEYSGARAPANVALKIELQKREDVSIKEISLRLVLIN